VHVPALQDDVAPVQVCVVNVPPTQRVATFPTQALTTACPVPVELQRCGTPLTQIVLFGMQFRQLPAWHVPAPPLQAVPLAALLATQAPVCAEHVFGLQGSLEAGQAVGA
jgi:hypothetical protein